MTKTIFAGLLLETPLSRTERRYELSPEQRVETLRRACQVLKEEFPAQAHLIVPAIVEIKVL